MSRTFGRSPRYDKPLTERVNVLFTEDHLPRLTELAHLSGCKDVSSWAREVLLGERPHPDFHPADIGTDDFCAPLMAEPPCGPWEKAVELAGEFKVSKDVYDELDLREGDVFVRAKGDSMAGRGIHDGDVIAVRPQPAGRDPRAGQIVLAQALTKDGKYFGTLKEWHSGGSPFPVLRDGSGKEFPYPRGTREVKVVAVAKGFIARL